MTALTILLVLVWLASGALCWRKLNPPEEIIQVSDWCALPVCMLMGPLTWLGAGANGCFDKRV